MNCLVYKISCTHIIQTKETRSLDLSNISINMVKAMLRNFFIVK